MNGPLLNGRYELTDRLGAGGMGVVWTAHDRLLHRTVAVKVLSGAGVPPEAAVRLEREVLDARGEDLYFRVEYPDTPAYRARAREVLATMQSRIVLRAR